MRNSNNIIRIIGIIVILSISISGCSSVNNDKLAYYGKDEIFEMINSNEMISTPKINNETLHKYPMENFLFSNSCFAFYRDMDYFLNSSARYDYLDYIIDEYPPQVVRTIDNNGQKSMYFVYQTDDNTRVFLFFFESDGFQYVRGFPIIMRKTLTVGDFVSLKVGDTLTTVEEIDPIASLYRKGYDTLSDELIVKLYVNGRERISTVHLLRDGIVKITYERDENGEYVINNVHISKEFIMPVIGGDLCYLIYPNDYIS